MIIAVPPYDIIGIGTPTIGSNPLTIPMFIPTYTKKLNDMPKHINLENVFLEFLEIKSILKIRKIKSKINTKHPKYPNCSAKTVNMKSVCFSGKKSKLLCDPFIKPFPKNPPDPIAILD